MNDVVDGGLLSRVYVSSVPGSVLDRELPARSLIVSVIVCVPGPRPAAANVDQGMVSVTEPVVNSGALSPATSQANVRSRFGEPLASTQRSARVDRVGAAGRGGQLRHGDREVLVDRQSITIGRANGDLGGW